jgi:hypothetical protein
MPNLWDPKVLANFYKLSDVDVVKNASLFKPLIKPWRHIVPIRPSFLSALRHLHLRPNSFPSQSFW